MKDYEVIYRTGLSAKNPMDAALQVEKILKEPIYRPCLEVKDRKTRKTTIIDLDTNSIVSRTKKFKS